MPAHQESSMGVFKLQIFGSHQANTSPRRTPAYALTQSLWASNRVIDDSIGSRGFRLVVLDGLTANSGSHQESMYRFPDERLQHPESTRHFCG